MSIGKTYRGSVTLGAATRSWTAHSPDGQNLGSSVSLRDAQNLVERMNGFRITWERNDLSGVVENYDGFTEISVS